MTSNTPETQALEPVEVTQADLDLEQWFLRRMGDHWKGNIAPMLALHRQGSNAGGVDPKRIEDCINAAIGHGEHGIFVDVDKATESILASISAPTAEPIDDRPDIVGDPVCKIATYNECHQVARELGYPSLTEALEHLSELKEALTTPPTPDRIGKDAVREAAEEARNVLAWIFETSDDHQSAMKAETAWRKLDAALSATPAQTDPIARIASDLAAGLTESQRND